MNKPVTDANDVSEEALKERSYLWMARVFGLIFVVTLLTDLILFYALDSLLPLVRVQPFYISTQDKDKQIIHVVRPSTDVLSSKTLQEAFVREYLTARLGIGVDREELKRRWNSGGAIQWMSSDSVYTTFLRDYAVGLIKLAEEEGLTRDVEILNVRAIPRSNGQLIWQSEVLLKDMSRSSPTPTSVPWVVEMEIRFGQLRDGMTWEERLQNPLGFQVNRYAQRINKPAGDSETQQGVKR